LVGFELVAIDNLESRADVSVFETPDGNLWVQPWMPYTAHYVLDRDELRRVIEDPSGVWITGYPAFDGRSINSNLYMGTEVISVGFQYKYSGNLGSRRTFHLLHLSTMDLIHYS